jgi:hypothetical protein
MRVDELKIIVNYWKNDGEKDSQITYDARIDINKIADALKTAWVLKDYWHNQAINARVQIKKLEEMLND